VPADDVREEAQAAVGRAGARRGSRAGRAGASAADHGGARWELDREIVEQLTRAVEPARRERIERRLSEAVEAFQAERFADAARILKALADQAPGVAAIRELYGLTLYRLGRWRSAIRELEAFETLTASAEQHPVLADCHRALGHWETVDELWEELRRAAPSPELVTEGRIVTAGARADRGDLRAAIALLEQGFRYPRSPKVHHLRRAYALADLYERAGDLARSRELFARIQRDAPDFADVDDRVRALR
jgi:tetratricopeptide (TPR) repeat protein